MEQISICDLEWYNGNHTFPNIKCMQLSSYYQQKGAKINFITEKEQFGFNYDKMYICRESEDTPIPIKAPIRGKNVRLIGKGFKYYENYDKLFPLLASVRPDYLLYNGLEGKFSNANFIQFFWGDTLITNRQDYHNTLDDKKFTVVVDKNFWQHKDEDIKWCLNNLLNEKNVMFLHSISLKPLIENQELRELFLKLHFTTGTDFKWRNNYSSEDVQPIIDFLLALHKNTRSGLGVIPIKAQISNDPNVDIYRCLQVIDAFKSHKLNCRIYPDENLSPQIFTTLGLWTEKGYKLSFIEFVLHNVVITTGLEINTILNNSRYWKNNRIDALLSLLCWDELREKGFLLRQWGDKKYNDIDIDYNYIKQNTSLLFRR